MLFKKLKRAEKDVAFLRYPSNIAKGERGRMIERFMTLVVEGHVAFRLATERN